jgi:hypothetical protein
MSPTQIIHEFAVKNMLVERYLLGELHGADLEDFEQHMLECAICDKAVADGDAVKQAIAAGVTAPPRAAANWEVISRRLMIASFYLASAGIVLILASPLSIVIGDTGKVLVFVAIGVCFFGLVVRAFIGGRS